MVTGIAEVTQDPEKAGNALKVLSLRLRGMKGSLEELGEETDANVENISKMQGQILNMTKGKVNIFDDTGNFKSTYEIMQGIAEVWDDLSSIDQADLLETIAGKHRANDVAALLSNWQNVEAAVKSASEAEGSAARENAKYVDSLQGRLDKLTTAWQSFANTFMSSDFLKNGVSVLTNLLEVIEKIVETLGTTGTIGLGAGLFGLFKSKGTGLKSSIFGALSNFGSVASSVMSSSDGLIKKFTGVGKAAGSAGGTIVKSFAGSLSGAVTGIGLAIAAIELIVNAYKNYREEQSRVRQEAIATSDEFLEAAGSFEQAYIKYSGRTDLTSEEETELEMAINGTVEALGDKSSALQDVVNSSNDYVTSLEKIAREEVKAASAAAKSKRDNAALELEEAAMGWARWDGSEVNIDLNNNDAANIAKDMNSKFFNSNEFLSDSGATVEIKGFTLSSDADVDEIIEYYNFLLDYQEKLSDADLVDTSEYKDVSAAIEKMSESIGVYTDGVYEAAKAEYQLAYGIPKTTEAYLRMREDILSDMGDMSFDTRKSVASSLDSEYSQYFDLSSSNAQSRKLIGLIDKYGDKEASEVETFLNMRTKVNDNECSVGDYLSKFDDINKMSEDWDDKSKEEFNTSFGLDTDAIKQQYDEIVKYYTRIKPKGDITGVLNHERQAYESTLSAGEKSKKEIERFLDSLSASELAAVVSLKTELDWERDSFDEILAQIQEEAELIEAISFNLNLEIEAEQLENLNTAITESISGAGLGTESISVVKGMFGGLDGYDQSALFERTAHGIRLNSDELRKLNSEYKKTNVDGLNNKIDALGERYNQTKEELYSLTYGTDEYNDKARELSDIEAQIHATETLAAQYTGLTSAYQEWQRAEASGSQRDMYENMIEGFETVGDEISRGWLDDGTIEFLELIKGEKATIIDGDGTKKEVDIATASVKELKQVWKDLDKNIEHTSYSVRDFFTVDEDGNSTSKGVYNFLDAIGQMEEEKFGGKDVVKRNDKGEIVAFDFQIAGGDKAIAEALGISEELVQIMKRAADDAGFVVSMDGTYQQLDVLKKKAAEAAQKLKETFKVTDYSFFKDGSEKGIKADYDEALKVWETFKKNKKEDGTIDMSVKGAEEAYTLVSTLQSMVDQLSEPVYMELNASQVEKDMQTPLSKLQEYETLVQTEHQLQLKGTDTSQIEADKEKIINYFDELQENKPEIAAKLGIENLSREEIQAKVEAGEIEIPATVDLQVEMNSTLRDMVNVALYNAGLIDKEELEARVDIKLYADKIDTSDVDDKVDNATENAGKGSEGKTNVKTNVNVEAGEVNTSKAEKSVEDKLGTTFLDDKDQQVKTDVEVDADEVNTSPAEKTLEEHLGPNFIDNIDIKIPQQELEVIVKYIANHTDIDKYSPDEKEAIVKFLADGGDVDDYTPTEKEAIVKYLVNGGDIDRYTPAEKEAIVKFLKNSGEVDSYTPAEKKAIAKFIKDSTEPDNYQPTDKTATAKYKKDSSEPDNYVVPSKDGTATYGVNSSKIDAWVPPKKKGIVEYVTTGIKTGASMGKKARENRGLSPVNGTANVNGTIGRAFKQGSWGTKNSGTALVGEIGPETLVRNGRYYVIGSRGAEFIKYQKGDIIFNHKQTEELFNNGKVTAGGGRAKAFVDGTAFLNGSYPSSGAAFSGKAEDGMLLPEVQNFTVGYDYKASSNKDSDKSQEIFDWIEVAIQRIEREIDNLDTKANSVYRSWSERNTALVSEINTVGSEITLQKKAIAGYQQALNEIGLNSDYINKIKSGTIDIDNITDETLAEKVKDYEKWYSKILECEDAILELTEKENDLIQQKFDNIIDRYDGYLSVIEHEKNMLEEYISQSESQGWLVSEQYYTALSNNEKNNIAMLEQERAELLSQLNSGEIQKETKAWYDMVTEIDEVTLAIEQGNTALLEYAQSIQEIKFEQFELLQDRIAAVTEEADFLIELLSNDKLHDDNGRLTNAGLSTMGLHGQNYNTYMYQADLYGEEAKRIEKLMKSSQSDKYDVKLLEEQYREMISLQQEYILNAEDEKNAIRDLVENGIELELDALQERIDAYNDNLDAAKDLYEYNKRVEEQTKNIASLRKQLASIDGDDSEEAKAKIQQLKVELEEAEAELEETEYDKYIADTEKLLDDLYLEYETILNERLDNVDALIMDMIAEINTNAGMISSTLHETADSVGYTLSTEMQTIWDTASVNIDNNSNKIKEVITLYGKEFSSKQTTTNTALNNIVTNTQSMINKLNSIANTKTAAVKTSSAAKSTSTSTPTKTSTPTTTTPKPTTSSGDGTPKIGDKVTFVSGKYYYDPQGKSPIGSKNLGKQVYITNINKNSWATHPIHISTGKKLGSGDLGWLKKNQISGYATGKQNFLNDEIAWTQENGQEFIVRPSDGAILTPIAKGDSVLTSAASNNIWDMANSPAEFIKNNLGIDGANVPNANVNNTYTQHIDNVVFRMDNVKNYDEMLSALQKDKNFHRLINAMTIDQIAGKSSLAKGKAVR